MVARGRHDKVKVSIYFSGIAFGDYGFKSSRRLFERSASLG
ncbi:hypothetical protein V2J92_06815 [Pseudomonas alliivorans]|nr:hypothetical protein [Pseudomonas alliivorans]